MTACNDVDPDKFDDAVSQLVSLRDWLRFAVSAFQSAGLVFGHGSQSAHDEAAYLILHTLHLPLDNLDVYLDARLLPAERQALAAILKKRVVARVPAAYLTHEAWQGEFDFYVDERVLVPRSFLHEIFESSALSPWIEHAELVHSALDLCTGSGALAIQMAHYFPAAAITGADISLDALEVAAHNIERYGLQERIELVHTDALEGLESYDLIVCNPPYVDAPSMQELPEEYQHEPRLALESGLDGLDFIRALLDNAADHLNPEGVLVVEIGHNREALEAALPHLDFHWLDTASGDGFVFALPREALL